MVVSEWVSGCESGWVLGRCQYLVFRLGVKGREERVGKVGEKERQRQRKYTGRGAGPDIQHR